MSEKIPDAKDFEQISHEVEQKFLPVSVELLDSFRESAVPIEQIYLSYPSEPYSLRIRETLKNGEPKYKATLKDSGVLTDHGIDRLEIEADVDANIYNFYRRLGRPAVRKLRAEPIDGIVIDYFDDGHVHAESEDPAAWREFLDTYNLHQNFTEITGNPIADNEWRAYDGYRRAHGEELSLPDSNLTAKMILSDITEHQKLATTTVVRISGRSGSGKSTLVREVKQQLESLGISPITLSTDDYHRGKALLTYLNKGEKWINWDSPTVYDLAALRLDVARLRDGGPIHARRFDFASEEPEMSGVIESAPVILLEGIYAGSHQLHDVSDLAYEVPTPLATCIGRRIMRDLVERPQFADASQNLRYSLEYAEPEWQNQATTNKIMRTPSSDTGDRQS